MGIDLKYGRVTTMRGNIEDDEPVFIIRGKDATAVNAILQYAAEAARQGADDATVRIAVQRAVQIQDWQSRRDDVKTPDTVPGQIVDA